MLAAKLSPHDVLASSEVELPADLEIAAESTSVRRTELGERSERASRVPHDEAHSTVPLFFGPASMTCFGFYHPAQGTPRSTGVVLCLPLGYEGTCAFETFTALAEQLASAGFDVLRFDYQGTGDSPGSDDDPDRVGAWRASISAAATELKRLSRARSLAFVGLRLGATLAYEVALSEVAVDSLVLWAPIASGRSLVRELKMAAASAREEGEEPVIAETGDLEALGFLYTKETLDQLGQIDLLKLSGRLPRHVHLIGRDARASEGALGVHLRARTELTFEARDGLAHIMRDSHERVVPDALVGDVVAWLSSQHPVTPCRDAEPQHPAVSFPSVNLDGIRERPLRFGPEQSLFGILTEPSSAVPPQPAAERTAILMLNVGTNHRVGPNRLYVKMARHFARAGYHALRFDLAGMGDSRAASGYATSRLYSKSSVADVQAAMDALTAQGCERFVLLGLCSGAYAAFQATLADPRVVAQVLLNPRRLSFAAGDTLESVMSESYKSRRYYQRALLSPHTYLRMARGEVNVRGIGTRMRKLVEAHARRLGDRLLGRAPSEEDVLSNVKLLCRRGVESLFVVGAEDDGIDYLEFHLGVRGSAVRSPHFRLQLAHGSDHTFSRKHSQDVLLDYVSAQLSERLARPTRPMPTRARWASAR